MSYQKDNKYSLQIKKIRAKMIREMGNKNLSQEDKLLASVWGTIPNN